MTSYTAHPNRTIMWSIITLMACLAGCTTREPQPAAEATNQAAAPRGGVTVVTDELQALATDLGNDHKRVELQRAADGGVVFRADFLPDAAQYIVTHELYTTAQPERGQWNLPRQPGQSLTQKSAIEGTLFLYQNVKSAAAGNYAAQDHYGCDLGPLGRQSSCSDVGACCDAHDQCYQANGCTTSSWNDQDLKSKCQQMCNVPALTCVLLQNPKPGKSSCCKQGADYCGQTRNPGEATPSVATPASVPRWDGEKQSAGRTASGQKKSGASGGKSSTPSASGGKTPSKAAGSMPSASGGKAPSKAAGSKMPSASSGQAPSKAAGSKMPSAPSTRADAGTASGKQAKSKSMSIKAAAAGKSDAGVRDAGFDSDEDDDDDFGHDDDDCDELGECDDDDYGSTSCDPDYDPFCDESESCDPSDNLCEEAQSSGSSTQCDDDDDDNNCEDQNQP